MDYLTALRQFEIATAAYCGAMREMGAIATAHPALTEHQLQQGLRTLHRCRAMIVEALDAAPGLAELVSVPPLPMFAPTVGAFESTNGKQ